MVRNPAIKTDRSELFFSCCLERKALIRPLMINKILCQLKIVEIRDWLPYRGQQNPLLITTLNVMDTLNSF